MEMSIRVLTQEYLLVADESWEYSNSFGSGMSTTVGSCATGNEYEKIQLGIAYTAARDRQKTHEKLLFLTAIGDVILLRVPILMLLVQVNSGERLHLICL